VILALFTADSVFGLPWSDANNPAAAALLPAHFDIVDCIFALVVLVIILKFVASVRTIIES
jgi:hypothetical protein